MNIDPSVTQLNLRFIVKYSVSVWQLDLSHFRITSDWDGVSGSVSFQQGTL